MVFSNWNSVYALDKYEQAWKGVPVQIAGEKEEGRPHSGRDGMALRRNAGRGEELAIGYASYRDPPGSHAAGYMGDYTETRSVGKACMHSRR